MTDRHAGYLVVLDHDIREDDAQAIIDAIRMVRGVLDVHPVQQDSHAQFIGGSRRDEAWRAGLLNLIRNGPEGQSDA